MEEKKQLYPHFEHIADLLWLSKYTGMQSTVRKEDPTGDSSDNEDNSDLDNKKSANIDDNEDEEFNDNTSSNSQDSEIHTSENGENQELKSKQKSAKAFQSPKKLALSNYRAWEKAFKFINLKQPSKNKFKLNEEKTVENIASSKVFDLVYEKVDEKNFLLTIVIDRSETMELWDELIKIFEKMLYTMGVFARISIYYWDTKEKIPQLYHDKNLKRKIDEKNILTDGKRNLIWVMSDCLSSSWRSGASFKSIEHWSKKSFTSIVQMFPKDMWMGTILFKGKDIRLSSKSFNPLNKKLETSLYRKEKSSLKIPIVSFDPYALQSWAKVVINTKNNSISGLEFIDLDFDYVKKIPSKDITVEMRMKRFYSQASPIAQQLAFYMSTLPVDFQVTRLLQDLKLKESNQAHVAEVFLGGLIERNKKNNKVNYDFYPEVRQELNANITADESFEIMEEMSGFVSSYLGIGFDFGALISNPDEVFDGDFKLSDDSIAFAKLASGVLKRRGGSYLDVASEIEKNIEKNTSSKLNNNSFLILEEPVGTVPPNSIFYIERKDDKRCYENLLSKYTLIRIQSPHQYGKTSLLARLRLRAKEENYHVVSFNFHELDNQLFSDLGKFLEFICEMVAFELDIEVNINPRILKQLTPKTKATKYMQKILEKLDKPLVLAIDEVDKLFEYTSVSDNFFGLIRAWHEKSKQDNDWEKLKILFSHSTEPLLGISSINQSPFHNVGLGIELKPFSKKEIKVLASIHHIYMNSKELEEFMNFIGGHPYLSRKILYTMVKEKQSFTQIVESAYNEKSIFYQHLRKHLWRLNSDKKLEKVVKSILENKPCHDDQSSYILESTGLIINSINEPEFSCNLYKEFFIKKYENDYIDEIQEWKDFSLKINYLYEKLFFNDIDKLVSYFTYTSLNSPIEVRKKTILNWLAGKTKKPNGFSIEKFKISEYKINDETLFSNDLFQSYSFDLFKSRVDEYLNIFEIGNNYIEEGEYLKAIETFDKILRQNPEKYNDYLINCNNQVQNYFNNQSNINDKSFESIMVFYYKALDLNRKSYEVYIQIGDMYIFYFKTTDLEDDNIELISSSSTIDYSQKAIEMYKKAIEINSNNEKGYIKLGDAYSKINMIGRSNLYLKNAIQAYKKVLSINPNNQEVAHKLKQIDNEKKSLTIIVVRILIENSYGEKRFNGTAFFIDNQTLITAKHVVENSILNGYKVYLSDIPDGGKYLVNKNDIELCERDIAVIKVKKSFDIPILGFTNELKVESRVKLIGYHNEDGTINFYEQNISGYTNHNHTYEIQDARTYGLSGSPVILDGKVCGIVQAITSKKGITYIIPISECTLPLIQNNLFSLKEKEKEKEKDFSEILDKSSFHIFLSRRYENTLDYERKIEYAFSKKDFNIKLLTIYPYDFNLLEEFSKLFNIEKVSIESNIHNKIKNSKDKYLLIIKDFENIDTEIKTRFSNLLRSLIENHQNFYIIIFGGKKLAQITYENGNTDNFSNATVEFLEMENSTLSQEIIDITGSHPKLNSLCASMEQGKDIEFYRSSLISSPNLQMIFNGYKDIEKLCRYFDEKNFGIYNPWHTDEFIRDLFWDNLLKEEDNRLVWRSEFIRETGKSLKCI